MNVTEFEYVLAVARHKSFSKASKALCVSQPAISSYISKIEKNLGGKIFDRSVAPIKLTELGKEYVKYAKMMLNATNEFQNRLSDINKVNSGKLVIGSTFCFSNCYLPKVIAKFKSLYKDIKISIVEGRVPDMQEMVLDGEVDLLITPPGVDTQLFEVEKIFDEKVYVAVPAEWEINSRYREYATPPEKIINGDLSDEKYADLSEFCSLPFISLGENQHIYKLEQSIASYYKTKIKTVMTVSQMATSFAFATAGVGATLTTETAVRFGNHARFPVLYPVLPKIVDRAIFIAYKKNSYRTENCRRFIEIFKSLLS